MVISPRICVDRLLQLAELPSELVADLLRAFPPNLVLASSKPCKVFGIPHHYAGKGLRLQRRAEDPLYRAKASDQRLNLTSHICE